jgi:hypothetical protein
MTAVPGWRRYLVEWALVSGVLLTLAWLAARENGAERVPAALLAVGLVALMHLPVFAVVARGLWVRKKSFFVLWGWAVLGKLAAIMVFGVWGLVQERFDKESFLISLALATPAFGLHQASRFLKEHARQHGRASR